MNRFITLLMSLLMVAGHAFAIDINGQLKNAQLEKSASAPVTNVVESRIYYNTTDDKPAFYNGASWESIVSATGTQTLTNKTLTSPTINTPSISSPTISGTALLQNSVGSQPELHLSEAPAGGSNVAKIKAPSSLSADYTLTLPTDDGSLSQVLTTDGSGVLSWSTVATDSLNQYNIKVGDASNVAASVNTNSVGDILAHSTNGLTIKSSAIDDSAMFTTGAIATSSSPGALGRYQTSATQITSTGHSPTVTVDFYFTRIANHVTACWEAFNAGGTSGAGYFTFSTSTVTSDYRPVADTFFAIPTIEGNVNKIGGVKFDSDGSVNFGATAIDDTFNGTTANGANEGCVSWYIH